MKTMKVFLLALLATTTGLFTACTSSEDSVADVNTTEERGVVKTEFTISFPQTTTGLTRLGADVVQVAAESNLTKFRGIKGIMLYPFTDLPADVTKTSTVPTPITLYGGATGKAGASSTTNDAIDGYDATTYSSTSGLQSLYKESCAHLYKNVDIAVGTKSFIFYGEAATTAAQSASEVGSLTRTLSATDKTLNGITYSPTPIFTGTATNANGTAIANYLTSIAATKDADNNLWSATTNPGLKTLYDNFTSITTGAWANVKAAVQRMYTNLDARTGDVASTTAMKTAIRAAIVNADYGVSVSGGTLAFSEDYDDYPADLGLPDGAAYVKWDSDTKAFSQVVTSEQNTGMNVAPLSNYVYPASLYYYVKSGILTSEEVKETYNDNDTWATITNAYTNGNAVTSKTRSIVIADPVQYAVARLDVTLKASSTLVDRNNANINLTSGGNQAFPITAIIVGGQKPVDYKFEQTAGTAYTVYDNQVADGGTRYLNTTATSAINTLLLETNDAASDADTNADVQIAIELQNNGTQTIVGYNGQLILPGTKFYLIGKIHPWKDGETIKKAFKQDYTTTVNLTVSNLKNARNTMPDLAVPQLDLGVTIDLTWQTGVIHNITID